jgi:hypothetical protein
MSANEQNGNLWIWGVVVFCGLATVVGSCSDSGTPAAYTPNRNSVEHRYATERFRQEGLSSKEAQQAADAVIKFHNAQKNK